jgi:DHA2 family multidrug resistance protein
VLARPAEVRARIEQMTNFFLAHGISDPAAAHRQAIIALGNLVEQQPLVMGFSDASQTSDPNARL